ncbi:hypothetical protein GMOD_00008412 [Pyrenophora seminiperda CCB06]|uniref:Uncharacterized protein n=1 Tax=Pyrenophora seminiperda CCB06 TaxID=1302712 RepID=A0A3M7M8E0_9PLEO|nr:hypothetical protein GMOD_00008412 [Pyrenophora seminiperda CCB06]
MFSQATGVTARLRDDHGLSNDANPIIELARHDTTSSTGSAVQLPPGYWTMDLSGNCPSCHHHHKALRMRIRVSRDSPHAGDVHCEKCKRLWLAFGQVNTTRISLLSTMSIEPPPLESEFRAALVHIIRAATPIAALSPTLTMIPEANSSIPSRETSVRSATRAGMQRPFTTIGNEPGLVPAGTSNSVSGLRKANVSPVEHRRTHWAKRIGVKGSRFVHHVKQRIVSKLPNHRLSFVPKRISSPEQHQTVREPLNSNDPPPLLTSTNLDDNTSSSITFEAGLTTNPPDVCSGPGTSADALASLKELDPQVLQPLPSHQRFNWGRKQFTEFRALSTSPTDPPVMVDNETQISISESLQLIPGPYSHRYSLLAHMGGWLGSNEYLDSIRGSNATLNGRPLSISETRLSDADTIVETLRGSRERRPHSLNYAMQAHWSRAEARRSIDSNTTGGAVRSMTTGRGHAENRLSYPLLNRTSSVYDTEPPTPRTQVQFEDEDESTSDQENPNLSLESPRTPPTTA